MAADGAGPDWTAMTQAIAAVVQAIAAGAALWASYRLAKRSHEDAVERDRMAVARADREHAALKRLSLEQWIGLLKRSRQVLGDMQNACRHANEGSAFYRSGQANLKVLVSLMERRAMDTVVAYETLKHVTGGIAAVQGTIAHLAELVSRADHLPAAQRHFLAHVDTIPAQLDACIAKLEERMALLSADSEHRQ